jgi:EpsI family protein
MTIKRLASLQACLLAGFGSVFLLPREIKMQPAAISLNLPESVGHWNGVDQAVTEGERVMLGPDTQFARKVYTNAAGDEIYASIVLSGPDMNTSIHRPERCLPAQGWTIVDSSTRSFAGAVDELKATRLHNIRSVRVGNNSFTVHGINYYWFVGHSIITPSHLQRTWFDIRDRILKGQNQQWAYVTIASIVTKDFRVFGHDEKQTDELIQDFIRDLVPALRTQSLADAK